MSDPLTVSTENAGTEGLILQRWAEWIVGRPDSTGHAVLVLSQHREYQPAEKRRLKMGWDGTIRNKPRVYKVERKGGETSGSPD